MRLQALIERLLLASRWLLLLFYAGLAVGLVIYAGAFIAKLVKLATVAPTASEATLILAMLGLVDAALVASLLVMVMISGYENHIRRIDADAIGGLAWLGKLDAGSLKVKVASSIVAISSIHLLQIFMDVGDYPLATVVWSTIMQLVFVVSAVMLAVVDRMAGAAKGGPPK